MYSYYNYGDLMIEVKMNLGGIYQSANMLWLNEPSSMNRMKLKGFSISNYQPKAIFQIKAINLVFVMMDGV